MNYINEYDLQPGIYKHYKGDLYVVIDIITHMENNAINKMELLTDPLVVYRDVVGIPGHDIKGKPGIPHKRYARALSEFTGDVIKDGVSIKRFIPQ